MDFPVTLFFYSLKNSRQGKDNNRQKSPAARSLGDLFQKQT
jgi:hypothetical protein